jgi:O-antigen/teichoic acid export membrane protein
VLLKRSLLTLSLQAAQLAALFGVTVAVSRATGPHGQGVFTLVTIVAFLAPLATGLGLSTASVYLIGRGRHPAQAVVSTILSAAAVSALLAVVVVAGLYVLLRHSYFRDVSNASFGLLLVTIVASQLLTACASLVLGSGRPVGYATLNALPGSIAFVLVILFWVAAVLSVEGALTAWALGNCVAAAAGLALARRVAPIRVGIDPVVLRAMASFGLQSYLANFASFLNYRLNGLIINAFLSVASLGYYSIAVALSEAMWLLANGVSTVVFPRVASSERAEANRLTAVVARNTLLATALGCLAMLLVGRWLVEAIFTAKMLPAVTPLWLLLPGTVALSFGKVASSYFSGIGKPIYGAYVAPINLVITVLLDLALIPRFGIEGAAAASSVIYTIGSAVALAIFVRESGNSVWESLVIQPEDFRLYAKLISGAYGRLNALLRPEAAPHI